MTLSNVLNADSVFSKNLKVVLKRMPLRDCTNSNYPQMPVKLPVKDVKSNKEKSVTNLGQTTKNLQKFKTPKKTRNVKNDVPEKQAKPAAQVFKNCVVILKQLQNERANSDVKRVVSRQSTPLVNRLRKCNGKNYFESILESSTDVSPINESTNIGKQKIPIYKQNIIIENKEKEKDPYELDISDTNKEATKKNRNLNNSRKFDKTMHDLLEKLDKKEKRQVRKKKVPKPVTKYDLKVNGALKKVMKKINDKKSPISLQTNEDKTSSFDRLKQAGGVVKNGFIGFETPSNGSINIPRQGKSLEITTCRDSDQKELPITSKAREKLTFIESVCGYESGSGFLGFSNENTEKPTTSSASHRVNIISKTTLRHADSPSHSCDDDYDNLYFGFDDNEDEVSTIESPAHFTQRRPNANSTMIGGTAKSPWRLTTKGKRNPHFLVLKNNSLPSLHQEMVMDHSLVEEAEQHSRSRLPCTEAPRPKPSLQTSILDYVEGPAELQIDHNQENGRRVSLFDYEEFVVAKPKRRVLGVLQENVLAESTPRKQLHSREVAVSAAEESFFGEDRENVKPSDVEKPFRINMSEIRQYKKAVRAEKAPEVVISEEGIEETDESLDEAQAEDVHLFEDACEGQQLEMSIELPKIKYQRKRRRRRLISDSGDENEEGKPKKKRKDAMTEAEKAAFEEWANAFNSMCKEVDEHQLEID